MIRGIYLSDKTLLIVLVCYTYCEREFDRLIERHLERPKKTENWLFKPKLELLYITGVLPEFLYHNLTVLNKVRNKFTHANGMTLEKINGLDLYKSPHSTKPVNLITDTKSALRDKGSYTEEHAAFNLMSYTFDSIREIK